MILYMFSRQARLGKQLMAEVRRNAHVSSPPRLEEVRRLLDAGADVNYSNNSDGDILGRAARSPWCSPEIVQLLIERGANVNGTQRRGLIPPLVRGAHKSDNERIRLLVDAGADMNVIDIGGRSALTELTAWADPELIEHMLARGADPNVGDCSRFYKPLHVAALLGRADLVALYIRYGADIEAKDRNGYTPIQRASEEAKKYAESVPLEEFEAIIQLLREAGAKESESQI